MLFRLLHATFLAIVLGVLLAACGGTSVKDFTEVAGPSDLRCQSSLNVPTIASSGGRIDAVVQAARECAWTVRADASWLQVSPGSGQGETPLTLTAAENPDPSQRSGSLMLNGQRVAVTQEAAPCRYTLGATRVAASGRGGVVDISVATASACSWTASSSESWVVTTRSGGTGGGLASFSVDTNHGSPRTAVVRVAGQSVTITQDTAPSEPEPSPTDDPASPAPAPQPPGIIPVPLPGLPPVLPAPTCDAEEDGDGKGKGKKREECDV